MSKIALSKEEVEDFLSKLPPGKTTLIAQDPITIWCLIERIPCGHNNDYDNYPIHEQLQGLFTRKEWAEEHMQLMIEVTGGNRSDSRFIIKGYTLDYHKPEPRPKKQDA